MKNVLYLSCHAILEYDECKLLSEAGYNVRAIGSYTNPHSPGDPKRPPIMSMEQNLQHIDISNRFHQDNLHQEHLDWADVVVFMHMPDWIQGQLAKLKQWGGTVVFRSIGQSSELVEQQLNNMKLVLGDQLKIVKYSKNELLWPNNAGADCIIPFYKDIPYTWNSDDCMFDVAFCAQSAEQRGSWLKFNDLFAVTEEANIPNRVLFGPSNEGLADRIAVQCPEYSGLLWGFAHSEILLYSGTIPAAYTLVPIEAMMVGTPILTFTDDWWRKGHEHWVPKGMFDVCNWIPDEVMVNNLEGAEMLKRLLEHPDWLQTISEDNRKFAMKHFSPKAVEPLWKELLG